MWYQSGYEGGFSNPYIIGGLACYASAWWCGSWRSRGVEVSLAYPMLSIGYVINAVAAWYLFGEALTAQRMVGIGTIVVGVFWWHRS
jgi:multidrug transporter EmrE-like cation transporter